MPNNFTVPLARKALTCNAKICVIFLSKQFSPKKIALRFVALTPTIPQKKIHTNEFNLLHKSRHEFSDQPKMKLVYSRLKRRFLNANLRAVGNSVVKPLCVFH